MRGVVVGWNAGGGSGGFDMGGKEVTPRLDGETHIEIYTTDM